MTTVLPSLPWITIAWSMNAAACLTFAVLHLVLWVRKRNETAYLAYAVSAVSAAAIAFFELVIMRASSVEQAAWGIRWGHLPVAILMMSLMIFVIIYCHASRWWLAAAFGGLRCVILIVNFSQPLNINYTSITEIKQVSLIGEETIGVVHGLHNPLSILTEISNLLFLVFFIDSGVTIWRRGIRRQAIMICGSVVSFAVIAGVHSAMLHRGIIHSPYIITIAWLGVLIVVGYELNSAMLRSVELLDKLRTSEADRLDGQRSLNLIQSAPTLGLWIWEVRQDSIWASESTRLLYGIAPGESINFERFTRTLHIDDEPKVRRAIDEALAKCSDFNAEYRIVLPDGVLRWIGARGRVECDADDRPTRIRGMSVDLTLHKTAELKLSLQQNELAHLSRVAVLGQLSGSLAHELNQPLAAILSNAQAAQRFLNHDPSDISELRAILTDIVQDDQRAGEVIQRLRLLFKKGFIQRDVIHLDELLQSVVQLVWNDLINHRVNITVDAARDLPPISGDRVQLQQVLLNLIMNARDAVMPVAPNRRQIALNALLLADEGIRVTVADCGVGIPPEHLVHIFNDYVTTKPQGLGLGLAICQTIVIAHGGRIWATNNPSGGANMHFVLPVEDGVEKCQ